MHWTRPSEKTVLVALLLAAAGLIAAGPGLAGWLRGLVAPALAPLGDGGVWLASSFRAAAGAGGADAARRRAAELEDELGELRAQRGYWRSRADEYAQSLRDMRAFRRLYSDRFGRVPDLPADLIPARVVAADALPYGRGRVVNAGGRRGVRPGQPVTTRRARTNRRKELLPPKLRAITPTALAGIVTETGPLTARIRLVTDRAFRMPARVYARWAGQQEPRCVVAEIRGDGPGGLVLPDVKAGQGIRPGDEVVTQPDALLPIEVRIGEVTEVVPQPKHPKFVTVRVRPYAELDTLRRVYIVAPLP